MIVSMTGFGDATAQNQGTHYAVEVRSLNLNQVVPVEAYPTATPWLAPGGQP